MRNVDIDEESFDQGFDEEYDEDLMVENGDMDPFLAAFERGCKLA